MDLSKVDRNYLVKLLRRRRERYDRMVELDAPVRVLNNENKLITQAEGWIDEFDDKEKQ